MNLNRSEVRKRKATDFESDGWYRPSSGRLQETITINQNLSLGDRKREPAILSGLIGQAASSKYCTLKFLRQVVEYPTDALARFFNWIITLD